MRIIDRPQGEKTNQTLTSAILAALGAHAGMTYAATETDASTSLTLEEVIVTVQRRNESIQDVPITIQALTGDQLQQLNITSFDEAVKYLPNVSLGQNGPARATSTCAGSVPE